MHFPRPAKRTDLELDAVPKPEIALQVLSFGFQGLEMHSLQGLENAFRLVTFRVLANSHFLE